MMRLAFVGTLTLKSQIAAPPVFVFASNRAGRHDVGAALFARRYRGAVEGQGEGIQGNSYAIPVKDENLETLRLFQIEVHAVEFLAYAASHRDMQFQLTAIGTGFAAVGRLGLASYSPEQIAPMFRNATRNVILPYAFRNVLESYERV